MRNKEIAAILYEIADLLDINGEEFKPNAYRRAARTLEGMSKDVEVLKSNDELKDILGIGEAIAEKIAKYLDSGTISLLERLRQQIPKNVREMLEISGVGPKTVHLLWKELGIVDVEGLKEAAETHRLSQLKGFGRKKEEKILKGIEFLKEARRRTMLGIALPLAEEIIRMMQERISLSKIAYAGSVRRMKETVGDLDFLAVSPNRGEVVKAFTGLPIVKEIVVAGETKATVIMDNGLQADLRVLDEKSWGAGLQYFTGSKDHNVHLRSIAQRQGLKLSEYGLFRGEEQVAGENEEGIYEYLGLRYIEPELREDSGEIAAAQENRLPKLVSVKDIRGDFHIHTNFSDGSDRPETVVEEALRRQYEYIGISEHSKSLLIAHGLNEKNLLKHITRIHALNQTFKGIKVLAGTECEILENGDLDYSDEVLKELDYVIVAIHSKFKMPSEVMTNRIVAALSHPEVNILAHPFTGLIHRREPIQFNFEKILEQAIESNVALEINAFPDRLDLSGPNARLAKERGAILTINTDSHSSDQLSFMDFGVAIARRGWLEADDILNCWSYEKLMEFFAS